MVVLPWRMEFHRHCASSMREAIRCLAYMESVFQRSVVIWFAQ